ncbi:unnamed protein product [Musa acuminata subsp. burmannicoides]
MGWLVNAERGLDEEKGHEKGKSIIENLDLITRIKRFADCVINYKVKSLFWVCLNPCPSSANRGSAVFKHHFWDDACLKAGLLAWALLSARKASPLVSPLLLVVLLENWAYNSIMTTYPLVHGSSEPAMRLDSWAVPICGRERMIPSMDSSRLFYQVPVEVMPWRANHYPRVLLFMWNQSHCRDVPPIMIQVWPLTVVKDCIFEWIRAFKLGDGDQKQASPPSCSMVGASHMSSQCSAGEFLEPDAPFDSIHS